MQSRPRDGTLVYKAFCFCLLRFLFLLCCWFWNPHASCRFCSVVLDAKILPTLNLTIGKGISISGSELPIPINVFHHAGLDTSMSHSFDYRNPFSLCGSSWRLWHSQLKASDGQIGVLPLYGMSLHNIAPSL